MDFKVHLLIYICVLMHVMDSIEGVNDHAHESRPENVRLLGIEPDLKHDMLVGMDRLKPEDDERSTTYSNSGHRSKSSEGAYPKGIYRLIVLPSKLQSIRENEYHNSFPVVKFKYLRTSINEERDILKSTDEFLRPEGMTIYKRRLNLDRNLTPIRRSTAMIGYLGDRSKVEQQLTMATSLVSEEDSMPGSLVDKSYSSQMRRDYLASLLRRIVASKYNHRSQALVAGGSKSRYSVSGREKIWILTSTSRLYLRRR
ncbi:uncharacterized protein LOC111058087 isoform X5 [Nilaparvata lugens]|nr:uncharacterized protein LOC111058087 isoform X5 [Nilaparvata lugens]